MTQIDRRAFMATAAAASLVPAAAVSAREAGWTSRASLPWPVQEIYGAAHDGKIVVAGGLVGRPGGQLHIEDRVGLYDPEADRWSEGPKLPVARHHPMVIAADYDLYVFGGYGRSEAGDWTSSTTGWVLADGEWKAVAPLPVPQAEAIGVSSGERLHLVTGRTPGGSANGQWTDQADTGRHWTFVVGTGAWEEARPCPSARNSAAGVFLDSAIWIAGGRTVSGGGTGRLDRYDVIEDRWDELAPIPRSYAANDQVGGGLAMAASNGKLVAFGGEWFRRGSGGGVFAETWIYDPARDAWAAGPPMKTPRHGLAAASTADGTIHAIAGGTVASGGGASGTVEAFRL